MKSLKKNRKTAMVLFTALAIVFACGCTKSDDPNNGGGNGNNDGGGHYNGNYEYVDLGLPSGTLWATFNLGAAKPEDYGDLFAWGETEPKDKYDYPSYKHGNGRNGEHFKFTKYCSDSQHGENGFTDTLTVLQPEDDAATVKWGDGWCMPTAAQYQELIDNTTHTYQYGTKGVLFTASNGKSLFFPAQKWKFDDNGRSFWVYGYCWTNKKGAKWSAADAFYFYYSVSDDGQFQNGNVTDFTMVNSYITRMDGYPVRPVRSSH